MGKRGFILLKNDLVKIYDRVRCVYPEKCLEELGLPRNAINVTKWCISTARMDCCGVGWGKKEELLSI